MIRRRLVAAALVAAAVPLAGCAAPAHSDDDTLQVLAAFYPLQYATERVGGDRVDVTSLTPPGVEPHDVELTPRQVAAIADADLIVYLKGFQPAVDAAVAQEGGDRAVDVGADLAEHDHDADADAEHAAEAEADADADHAHADADADHAHADADADHAHADAHAEHAADADADAEHAADAHADADAHAHADADADADDGHDHEGPDPHVWLDPMNLATIAARIDQRLAVLDPAGAAAFAAGTRRLHHDLTVLDAQWRRGTRQCANRTLVVSHAAFGYLADRYDFTQVGISGLSPDSEPSPAALARIADLVRAEGVTTIYYETLVDPKVAETLAAETGTRTAVLDPIEGIAESSDATYFTLMRANLAEVRTGQGCA